MNKPYLALFFWFFLIPAHAFSSDFSSDDLGNRIALSFYPDHAQQVSQETLQKAAGLGIDLVEISDFSSVSHLSFDEYTIFLRHTLLFPTSNKLTANRESIVQNTVRLLRDADQLYPGQAVAINLFSFPNEKNSQFYSAAAELADTLSQFTDLSLYYQSAQSRVDVLPSGYSFYSGLVTPDRNIDQYHSEVIYFKPSAKERESIQSLENVLNEMVQKSESITIIPAHWFAERLETNSGFGEILRPHIEGNLVEFPLPAAISDPPPMNWSVVLLVIIWISFVLHYRTQPGYSAILTRYFTAHSFFVTDIKENRLRSSAPPFVILFQHALLAGLCFYVAANSFISQMGLDALTKYFPFIFIEGYQLTSFFVIGTVLALLSHLVSVFWLFIMNKQATHLSQVLNLYSWPLHLNLLLVTLLVILSQAESSELWIFITASAFVVVWFLSFNFAAVDCAKLLEKFGSVYLLFTVGLHFLLLLGAVILLFNFPFVLEPFQLAYYLP